jgi:hypothetical protein
LAIFNYENYKFYKIYNGKAYDIYGGNYIMQRKKNEVIDFIEGEDEN